MYVASDAVLIESNPLSQKHNSGQALGNLFLKEATSGETCKESEAGRKDAEQG